MLKRRESPLEFAAVNSRGGHSWRQMLTRDRADVTPVPSVLASSPGPNPHTLLPSMKGWGGLAQGGGFPCPWGHRGRTGRRSGPSPMASRVRQARSNGHTRTVTPEFARAIVELARPVCTRVGIAGHGAGYFSRGETVSSAPGNLFMVRSRSDPSALPGSRSFSRPADFREERSRSVL
jgi:hypothetical protein